MGVCTADVDGDGWEDLYVTVLGGNKLYRNNHDGTFADITARAGLSVGGWSAGCGFADYDRDGDLDLFVSRYVSIDLKKLPQFGKDKTCEYRGIAVQCGPRGLPGETDFLFQNDGSGKFADVSKKAGVSDPRAYFGLGVGWFDYNGDGWLDLYVANDSTPNFLYVNQKDGTFKDMAFPLGVAVSQDGTEQGSMGVALGDYDNTGRFHVWVTNFAEEYNALYYNQGDYFTDNSFQSKTAAISLPYVGWGNALIDYDNDTLLDMIAVNGHVYPQLDKARLRASAGYRQRKLLFHNRGDGTFDEVAAKYGPALDGGARPARARRRRHRQRRPPRHRDQRSGWQPAAAAQRASGRRQLADRQAEGQGPEHRCDRFSGRRTQRQDRSTAAGAERQQLHLAGRQAPALRAREGRRGRRARGDAGPTAPRRRWTM